ncbi:hypothetical protein PMKS-004223 [Pichia membranifaciens]|uniref:WD-like domain-containing protein n=1 Tax=Pichia membranifaciens TaxID=4926 RepID=A0A1Q2YME4_9ASCO|nr:hypothetical protein PMKS-004223 [Pichia membranifaciens]
MNQIILLQNYFLALLLASGVVSAAGLSYTDSITVVLENRISPNDNSTGFIDVSPSSRFEKYGLVGAENFVLLTFSSFNYLFRIQALSDLALRNGLLGDAFLIYHKLVFNGQVNETVPTIDSKMAENMAVMLRDSLEKGGNVTFLDLAGKCSSEVLSKYYYTLENSILLSSISQGHADDVQMSDIKQMNVNLWDDVQIDEDCKKLRDILASDDVTISPSPLARRFAWKSCCKAYPANATLSFDQMLDPF